jgi:hypothetical protein
MIFCRRGAETPNPTSAIMPIPSTHTPLGSVKEELPVVTVPAPVSTTRTPGTLAPGSKAVENRLLSSGMNRRALANAPISGGTEGTSSSGANPAPALHAGGIPEPPRPGMSAPGSGV